MSLITKLEKYLNQTRSLPETARKVLAAFFILIAAFILFEGWSGLVSYKTDAFSGAETSIDEDDAGQKNADKIASPVEGMMSSLSGLKEMIPGGETKGIGRILRSGNADIKEGFGKIRNFLNQTIRRIT